MAELNEDIILSETATSILTQWGLKIDQIGKVFGGLSSQSVLNLKRGETQKLKRDLRDRVRIVLAIYDQLSSTFNSETNARRFLESVMPNLAGDQSLMDHCLSGDFLSLAFVYDRVAYPASTPALTFTASRSAVAFDTHSDPDQAAVLQRAVYQARDSMRYWPKTQCAKLDNPADLQSVAESIAALWGGAELSSGWLTSIEVAAPQGGRDKYDLHWKAGAFTHFRRHGEPETATKF